MNTTKTDTPETVRPSGAWSRSDYVREYDKLERERDALIRANEWQPISTAPKDGPIMIGRLGEQRVSIRLWGEDEDGSYSWQLKIRGSGQATHWKPLSPPSKQ